MSARFIRGLARFLPEPCQRFLLAIALQAAGKFDGKLRFPALQRLQCLIELADQLVGICLAYRAALLQCLHRVVPGGAIRQCGDNFGLGSRLIQRLRELLLEQFARFLIDRGIVTQDRLELREQAIHQNSSVAPILHTRRRRNHRRARSRPEPRRIKP